MTTSLKVLTTYLVFKYYQHNTQVCRISTTWQRIEIGKVILLYSEIAYMNMQSQDNSCLFTDVLWKLKFNTFVFGKGSLDVLHRLRRTPQPGAGQTASTDPCRRRRRFPGEDGRPSR